MTPESSHDRPLQMVDPTEPSSLPPFGRVTTLKTAPRERLQMFDPVEPNYGPAEILAISPREALFLRNLLNRVGLVELQRFIQSLKT